MRVLTLPLRGKIQLITQQLSFVFVSTPDRYQSDLLAAQLDLELIARLRGEKCQRRPIQWRHLVGMGLG